LIVATVLTLTTFFGFTEGLQLDLPVGFEFINQDQVIIDEDGNVVEEETW
jgi:hypothetical protein